MSQVIVYTNSNGGVSVCYPTGELSIEEVKAKDTPKHSIIVEDEDLPTIHDDLFDAWELIEGVIVVNHGKATDITKDRLRRERKPLLEAQDIAFQKALEINADTAAIIAEKQRLGDITQLADGATTIEELKDLTARITALETPVVTPTVTPTEPSTPSTGTQT